MYKQSDLDILKRYDLIKFALLEICDDLKTTNKQEISSSLEYLLFNFSIKDRNHTILLLNQLSEIPESFTFDNVKKELIQIIPSVEKMTDEVIKYLVNMISVQYTTKKLTI